MLSYWEGSKFKDKNSSGHKHSVIEEIAEYGRGVPFFKRKQILEVGSER